MGVAHSTYLENQMASSANARISLGVAFLSKKLNTHTFSKCIIHAEFVVTIQKYLLTKITYTHNRNVPENVVSSEIECVSIVDALNRLSKSVQRKVDNGFTFDPSAMESIGLEVDETWDDFQMAGSNFDDEEAELDAILAAYHREPSSAVNKKRIGKIQTKSSGMNAPRKTVLFESSRSKHGLLATVESRSRYRQ